MIMFPLPEVVSYFFPNIQFIEELLLLLEEEVTLFVGIGRFSFKIELEPRELLLLLPCCLSIAARRLKANNTLNPVW